MRGIINHQPTILRSKNVKKENETGLKFAYFQNPLLLTGLKKTVNKWEKRKISAVRDYTKLDFFGLFFLLLQKKLAENFSS